MNSWNASNEQTNPSLENRLPASPATTVARTLVKNDFERLLGAALWIGLVGVLLVLGSA